MEDQGYLEKGFVCKGGRRARLTGAGHFRDPLAAKAFLPSAICFWRSVGLLFIFPFPQRDGMGVEKAMGKIGRTKIGDTPAAFCKIILLALR